MNPKDLSKVQSQARNRLMLSQAHGDDELVLLRELMRMDRNADQPFCMPNFLLLPIFANIFCSAKNWFSN